MSAAATSTAVQDMLAEDASLSGPGITVLAAKSGRARATMTVRADHLNGHGLVHGGLVFMLADTALACAANSAAAGAVTGGADVTFLGSAAVGQVLVAEAKVRSRVGRSLVVDVTVRTDGAVVAEMSGRAVLRRAPDLG